MEWIGTEPFLLLKEDSSVIAALACPPENSRAAWIRLFAVTGDNNPNQAWNLLWPQAKSFLEDQKKIEWVSAIPIYDWFKDILIQNNFTKSFTVAMLSRHCEPDQDNHLSTDPQIRELTQADLDAVISVDGDAFIPIWQFPAEALYSLFGQALVATIFEENDRILGFQITTPTPNGAHIARLAVASDAQRTGIGSRLLKDLLFRLSNTGIQNITVNTQKDNVVALALYLNAGFDYTGEEYQIFTYKIE